MELFTARLAERAGRYNEMVNCLRKAVPQSKGEASQELRNLLSVGFKGALSQRRFSWRILNQAYEKEMGRGMNHGAELVKDYRKEVETEIMNLAQEASQLAEKMIPDCRDSQAKTHLMLLRADCARYIAEVAPGGRKDAAIKEALGLYDETLRAGLPQTHHTYLSAALNKAIFLYEVMGERQQAIQLLEGCLGHISTNPNKREQNVITSLITNNLKLWQMGKQ